MMFPFPALGGFNFDAREFSIQSIDDTEHESSDDSQSNAAKHKRGSCAATGDKSRDRNLVWRDSRFAKDRHNRGFDWCVDISGKIQGAFLRRTQNNPPAEPTILFPGRHKTEWPHAPTHAD